MVPLARLACSFPTPATLSLRLVPCFWVFVWFLRKCGKIFFFLKTNKVLFFLCVVCLLSQLFLGFCLSMGFGADSFLKMLALHGFWWGFHILFLFVVFSWLCSFNPPFGFWGSWGNEMKKISTLMPILCSEGAILGLCLVHQCVLRFAIMEFQCSSWTEWRTRTRFFLMGSLRENRERKECEILNSVFWVKLDTLLLSLCLNSSI